MTTAIEIENLPVASQVTFRRGEGGFSRKLESYQFTETPRLLSLSFLLLASSVTSYSSSMEDFIARYKLNTKDVEKLDQQPSPELQMEEQDLEELNIDELQKLEDEIKGGLSRVLQTKDESIMSQILALETKVRKCELWSDPKRRFLNHQESLLPMTTAIKIENLPVASQVTFSKRRRRLFKKARELSVHCDAEVGVVVFSAAGKLHVCSSSSSMDDVIARYKLHTEDVEKLDQQPCPELQLENDDGIRLNKELADKIRELRQMEGQDLEELNIDELQNLEDAIEGGLSRVLKTKDERIMSQILALETKGAGLIAANNQLQQRIWMLSNGASGVALESEISSAEEGMSSESATSCFSTLDDDDSDDILSLKLAGASSP
ncbi:hypothetical protein M0R45_027322 [Rubus argutus]|uniref:Uncharacterized protein n=1 Tax=Rubus argutus TaxID=59490 RepID=A0AAW1X2Q0_RUBAR